MQNEQETMLPAMDTGKEMMTETMADAEAYRQRLKQLPEIGRAHV